MDTVYQELLSVLNDISEGLIRLIGLQQKKKEIVAGEDLVALNEVINSEQAEALHFRGLEQKRSELLQKLNLHAVGMKTIPSKFPAEIQQQAQQAVDNIQTYYQEYQSTSKSARKVLEKGIAEIDHVLAAMGEPISAAGLGYKAEETTPPSNMKTDFRA